MSRSLRVLDPLPTVAGTDSYGNPFRVERDSSYLKAASVTIENVSPEGTLPTLNTGSYNDFYIRGSLIDSLKEMVLEVQLTNTGSTGCVGGPAPLMINYVEIAAGSNSAVIEQVYGESLIRYWADDSYSKTVLIGSMEGFSPSTYSSSATTISASNGTLTQQILIPNCLTRSKIPLSFLVNPRIRVYWSAGYIASTSNATAANIQITSAQLYLLGEKFAPAIKDKLLNDLRATPHSFGVYFSRRQIISISSSSMATTNSYRANLSSFTGEFSELVFFTRYPSANNENIYQFNYTTPSTPSIWKQALVTLYNASGLPVWTPRLSSGIASLALGEEYTESPFLATFPWIMMNFTDSPKDSNEDGINGGGLIVNNSFVYEFSPAATFSNGADLVVLAMQRGALMLDTSGNILPQLF